MLSLSGWAGKDEHNVNAQSPCSTLILYLEITGETEFLGETRFLRRHFRMSTNSGCRAGRQGLDHGVLMQLLLRLRVHRLEVEDDLL